MTDITIIQSPEQQTAGIRERIPMADLTDFFARAFEETLQTLRAQGLSPAGPPFGKYYGSPGESVDVEAGFPVSSAITPDGDVAPGVLPGGSLVEAVHIGSYDTLERTYSEVERYFTEAGISPGPVMWESYLTDPGLEPDPEKWHTLICWPST